MSSLSQRSLTHLGMDVHKDSISLGILRPDDSMDVERIFHDEESVRRFIARMGEPRHLVACYEAGPSGYELHRLLQRLQVPCHVVAPSRQVTSPAATRVDQRPSNPAPAPRAMSACPARSRAGVAWPSTASGLPRRSTG